MRSARFALISLVIMFLLITGIGMLFSSRVTVVRQVDIRAPKDSIFQYISDIHSWNKWMVDSTQAIAFFTDFSNKKGASAQIGHSRVTISELNDSLMATQWQGTRGNPQTSDFVILPSKEVPSGWTVRWSFSQELNWYPWQRIGASLQEKVLGPSMEKALEKLKADLEK
ncbi:MULTISPECIES: SRPBCC family protein [Chitinophagaceae]